MTLKLARYHIAWVQFLWEKQEQYRSQVMINKEVNTIVEDSKVTSVKDMAYEGVAGHKKNDTGSY